MKHLAALLFALAIAGPLGATAQQPDVLTIGKETYAIFTNPLVPYLQAHPDRLPEPALVDTSLWRGYIAVWEIRDNQLLLDDVRLPTKDWMSSNVPESQQTRSAMKSLFDADGPQVATWFTGRLIIPTGEMVDYIHMGYGSTFSAYLVITVVDGTVREQRKLNEKAFSQFRKAQFAAFRKTPEYAARLANLRKDGDSTPESMTERFLFEFASEEYLARIFETAPRKKK